MTDQIQTEHAGWNWPETLMGRIPANYLLVSYLLFILLFGIYYLFSWEVPRFYWLKVIEKIAFYYYDTRLISQSLAQSFLVPFLTAGLIYLSRKTRETFRYIDRLHGNNKNDYYGRLEARMTGARSYHLLLLLSFVIPFVMMSWGQWDYQRAGGYWAWGLDIYNYLLSFLILALLTELVWLMGNIVWTLNEIGCVSGAFSGTDVFSINMKLRPIRNFFLVFIAYYFIAIALVIATYVSPSKRFSLEPIYFMALLLIGVVLFVAGLETIQRIISCRLEGELDILNRRRDEQHQLLLNATSTTDGGGKSGEIETISKVLDIIQKERDGLMQVNRRGYDIASLSLFISSFLIPLLTLLEKLQLLPK